MKIKVALFFVLLAVSAILVSCDPSQAALDEQTTQTADMLAATRTQVYLDYQASKPTATLTATITPTPTNTLTSTLPATLPYHYFRMSSTLVGWAWGWIDGADHLWRTKDGGLTWVDVSPQGMELELKSNYFLDPLNAWVAVCGLPEDSCGLAHTSDGGETWTVINDSIFHIYDYSLQFFNEREGIMYSYDVGAGGGLYRFLETQNGGTTWTAVIFYSGHLGDNSLGDRMGEYKVCNICGDALYLDQSRLIVVFGQGDIEPQDHIGLVITTNRGQSFKELILSLPPGRFNPSMISPHQPVFFDDNVGILSVDLMTEDESHAAVAFYATTDGGLNWTFRSFVEMESGSANRFRSRLDFVSYQDIFVRCGENLCVTHDGAQTWQTLSSNLNFGEEGDYPVGLLDFVDATTGWASIGQDEGEKTLWRTTDGGQTWQELSPVIVEKDLLSPTPTSSAPTATPTPTDATLKLTSMHMINETDGWGIRESSVWITRDGGRNWRDVTPPTHQASEGAQKIYASFIDDTHAMLLFAPKSLAWSHGCISTDAKVWHTADGGQTWEASQPLMHNINMDCSVSFSMLNTQTGWLRILGWYTGAGGGYMFQLFRTIDGGSTWSTYNSGEPALILKSEESDWAFINEETGWQLENASSFYSEYEGTIPNYQITTDGGETWEEHSIPAPLSDPDLFFDLFNPYQYRYCDPYQLNLLTEKIVRFKVVCLNRYGEDPEPVDYLFASEDGGITWRAHVLPVSSEEMATRLLFFDTHHGLLLGREMWRTEDGGATWELMNSVNWDGQFSFIDRWRGWAVAESDDDEIALVCTTNGGVTWKMLDPAIIE